MNRKYEMRKKLNNRERWENARRNGNKYKWIDLIDKINEVVSNLLVHLVHQSIINHSSSSTM